MPFGDYTGHFHSLWYDNFNTLYFQDSSYLSAGAIGIDATCDGYELAGYNYKYCPNPVLVQADVFYAGTLCSFKMDRDCFDNAIELVWDLESVVPG
jgi:hypothetical protein